MILNNRILWALLRDDLLELQKRTDIRSLIWEFKDKNSLKKLSKSEYLYVSFNGQLFKIKIVQSQKKKEDTFASLPAYFLKQLLVS